MREARAPWCVKRACYKLLSEWLSHNDRFVAIVVSVSPSWVKMTAKNTISSVESMHAIAFASAVMDEVNSMLFIH